MGGVVEALGGDAGEVTSPTFTLENRYPLAEGLLVHADLYRTEGRPEPDLLGSLLEARDEGAVVVVEWAEALRDLLAPCWEVELTLLSADAAGRAPRRLVLSRLGDRREGTLAAPWREAAS